MNTSIAVLRTFKTVNNSEKQSNATHVVENQVLECQSSDSSKAVRDLWDEQTRYEMDDDERQRLASAKRLIRKRQFARAKAVLQKPHPTYAESLNVLGIIHEALKDFDSARNCYGQARSKDKNCLAARLNGQRIYELHAFGRSAIPVYL